MRLILSTILAAALVFGGTLLFAGYFEGIEVPEHEPDEYTSGPHSMYGLIPGELWHCPHVERILAAPLPEIFLDLSPQTAEIIAREYKWHKVGLWSVKYVADVWVRGQGVTCEYRPEEKTRDFDLPWVIRLSLKPDWQANIPPPTDFDTKWFQTEYRPDGGGDQILAEYECNTRPRDCGFYVLPAE